MTTKNSEEKRDTLHRCLMSVVSILSKMAESAASSSELDLSSVLPLAEKLTNTYSQKTINTALVILCRHLDDGIVKIGLEDVARTPSKVEKATLLYRIFFLSFIANGMFLVDREEKPQ